MAGPTYVPGRDDAGWYPLRCAMTAFPAGGQRRPMHRNTLHSAPSVEQLQALLDPRLLSVAEDVRSAGGRALLVGGWVRDALLGITSKDVDVEVRGLELPVLREILGRHGEVQEVGRSFGVFRLRRLDVDFALPRVDSKVGPGHRGIQARVEPHLDLESAARRRDLTINAIALDPLDGELLDPLGGVHDLRAGVLRACDPASFGEDPLRAIRVAQFAARFEMEPDSELLWICHDQDLSELSGERVFDEFRKMLLKGSQPSLGLALLERTGLLRFYPELDALVGVPQDPAWHPEGDVWVHTLMVVDEAANLRLSEQADEPGEGVPPSREIYEEDLALMFGALCHDLGKPHTTVFERGHIRSPGHDVAGEAPSRSFLERMRAPHDLIARARAIARHHLAPAMFFQQASGDRAYRRLARRLARANVSMQLLERVARADHFGRTTEDAIARRFPAGDHFVARARALEVEARAPEDVVQGRHLVARGLRPGPQFSRILHRCREIQDDTGCTDPESILERVLPTDPADDPPDAGNGA